MKNTKTILLSALITIFAFGAITYTSCTKDPCSGVNCQNGGACSGGTCSCPSGFSGDLCQYTSITYNNDTYTPVTITANGSVSTIPAKQSITYNGTVGSTLTASAYTSGTTSSGTTVGNTIIWDASTISASFSASGAVLIPLDISSDYFFLNIINDNGSNAAQGIYVNYDLTTQTFDNVAVPNDGQLYGIGYYLAFSNTEIYVNASSGSSYWTAYPSFSFTTNQQYTMTLK